MKILLVITAVLVSTFGVSSTIAAVAGPATQDVRTAADVPVTKSDPGPICGVRCVYVASRVLGAKSTFVSLLNPAYIGSTDGSSLVELVDAARSLGLYAAPVLRMTTADLVGAGQIMILHVRSVPGGKYDHFVLLLKAEGSRLKIFDPKDNKIHTVRTAWLARRWDGASIALSERPIPRLWLVWRGWLGILLFVSMLLILVCIARTRRTIPGTASQVAAISLLAVIMASVYHLKSFTGFWSTADGLKEMREAYGPIFLPTISLSEVQRAVDDPKVLIIDARDEKSYRTLGHIPRAQLLAAEDIERYRGKLKSLISRPTDLEMVVVYCGNPECSRARSVGEFLRKEGLTNVRVFEGGWSEWLANSRARN